MKKLNEDVDVLSQYTDANQKTAYTLTEQQINAYKKKMILYSLGIFIIMLLHWIAYFLGFFRIWSAVATTTIFVIVTLIINLWHKAIIKGLNNKVETLKVLDLNKQCFHLSALLLCFAYVFKHF